MSELIKTSIDTTKHKELYSGRKEKDTIDTMALARVFFLSITLLDPHVFLEKYLVEYMHILLST